MSTLIEAVEALASVIDTISGLRVTDHVPDATEYPAAFIDWQTIDSDSLDDSGGVFEVEVVLLVGTQVSRNQKKLLPWVYGPTSIREVLQANRSLGLDDVDAHATQARRLGLQEMAAYNAYGAVQPVTLVLS
jgi:hypothetical protein